MSRKEPPRRRRPIPSEPNDSAREKPGWTDSQVIVTLLTLATAIVGLIKAFID